MTNTDRKRESSGTRLHRLSLLPKLMVGRAKRQPGTETAESQNNSLSPEWPLKSNMPVDIHSAYPVLPCPRELAPPRPLSANSMSPTIFNVGILERPPVSESAGRRSNRASWGIFLNPRKAAPKSPQHRELGDLDTADIDKVTARVEARISALQGDKADFFQRGRVARPSPRELSSESWGGDFSPRPDDPRPAPSISTPVERGRQQNRHTVYLDMTFGSKTIGNGLLLRPEPSEEGRIVNQEAAVTSRTASDSIVTITCTEPTPCYTKDSFSRSETSAAMLSVPSFPPKQTRTQFLDPALLFFVPQSKPVTHSNVVTNMGSVGHHEDTASPAGATLCVPSTTVNFPGAFELEATPVSPCGSDPQSKPSSTMVSPLENAPGDPLSDPGVPGPLVSEDTTNPGHGDSPEIVPGQPSGPSSIYSADEHTLVDEGEKEVAESVVGFQVHQGFTPTKPDPVYHSAIKARIMMESPTGNTACDAWLVRSRMFQLGGSPVVASSPVHEADRFLLPALA